MASFEHLLLTRFNVRLDWSRISWNEAWLRRRIDLFETYCLPSVRQQTNQQFKWIVFFDEQSPDFMRQKIDEYRQYSNFIPVFTPIFNSGVSRDTVTQHLTKEADYIITTRLDNDDAVASNFIQNIQSRFIPGDMTFLNFLYGFWLAGNKVYRHRYRSNTFISLIEAAHKEKLRTVYCGVPHGDYGKIGTIINIRTDPAWLIVAHEDNIINTPRGCRQSLTELKKRFPRLPVPDHSDEKSLSELLEKITGTLYYKLSYAIRDLLEK